MKAYTTRYVVRTVIGKPLFIVAETKAINGSTQAAVSHYSLSDQLVDAAKCVNKETARTLIADYTAATGSTKTFKIFRVDVTYSLEEDLDE